MTENSANRSMHFSGSRFQMPKFIFLDMPPTSNDRKRSYLPTYFFLAQCDRWNFEQFDFKVPFATDPRWSIWAGIVPCIRITWRDKQLFKSYGQLKWAKYNICEPQRPDENRLVRIWDHEFSKKGKIACCMKCVIVYHERASLKFNFRYEYWSEQLNCDLPDLRTCRFGDSWALDMHKWIKMKHSRLKSHAL